MVVAFLVTVCMFSSLWSVCGIYIYIVWWTLWGTVASKFPHTVLLSCIGTGFYGGYWLIFVFNFAKPLLYYNLLEWHANIDIEMRTVSKKNIVRLEIQEKHNSWGIWWDRFIPRGENVPKNLPKKGFSIFHLEFQRAFHSFGVRKEEKKHSLQDLVRSQLAYSENWGKFWIDLDCYINIVK